MRRCIYHTDLVFQDKLHSVNIQDDQSLAFSETVQKISKITYTAMQAMFMERLKTNGTAIKIAKETSNNQ